jgi:hypothetical protein
MSTTILLGYPPPCRRRQSRGSAGFDRILALKRDAAADVTALEREIDELVYALYGLTPEEIKIVEGAAKK